MSQDNSPRIAFTIENQLEAYSRAERHTQRHETLWHAWNQNRRWLSQLLEMTLPAFPTYSRHDESHSKSVLHNIERLLGEPRIRQLSASDCFMLLHVTYVHDIGMCITAEDRKKILSDDAFVEMLDRILEEGDESLQRAVQNLIKSTYEDEEDKDYAERMAILKKKYKEKLEVYYAVVYLMAEYQRKSHAEKASSRIHEWTIRPEQLGTGFSMSGIPLRLFLRIADCAALHTDWDFSHILDLPKEDSGYAHDMIHPRFVAVMLQLGDALDIDNDRFHLFTKPFIGELPEMSAKHFEKHQSIRQLQICPEEIVIEADCDNQEALRLVRNECDAIEDILKSASYHWSEISPSDLNGCLPTMRPPKIKLMGKAIPIELVSARFNISQVKAFQLLEGSNVYLERFVFLREVLQNAIDATKLQYWEDYKNRSKIHLSKRKEDIENVDFEQLVSQFDVTFYPIEFHFKIVGRRHKNSDGDVIDEYVSIEDIAKEEEEEIDVGVLVSIKDYGTGISKADLSAMSAVGDSLTVKKRKIFNMPEWLQPTGQFGIGLQSVFLICRSFTAYTRTHGGEAYEITFNSAVHQQGYINTKPRQMDERDTFGTRFEIFVDCKHKLPHKQCRDAWNLNDPDSDRFSSGYETNRKIRHSKELLSQMVIFINELIGEPIFPIYIRVDSDCIDEKYMKFVESHADKTVFDSDYRRSDIKYGDIANAVSWIFRAEKDHQREGKRYIVKEIENGLCAFDCQTAKLHIWNSRVCTSATMGTGRLMADGGVGERDELDTKVYLKGIYICNCHMDGDSELLESLDIKGRFKREYINLNRNEFTESGNDFLAKIYEEIMSSFREALEKLSGINDNDGKGDEDFGELIYGNIKALIRAYEEEEEKTRKEEIRKRINETALSALCLSFFVRIRKHKEANPCCRAMDSDKKCQWIKLSSKMMELLTDEKNKKFFTDGFFKPIPVYSRLKLETEKERKTGIQSKMLFPQMLDKENKIAIVSRREEAHSKWIHYVLLLNSETFQLFIRDIYKVEDWHTYMEEMEAKGNELLSGFETLYAKIKTDLQENEMDETEYDVENQKVLKWMLSNIPSCGIWSSLDGNVRMNVLTDEIPNSVYFNTRMKYLLLERIREQFDKFGGKRYVTLVWKGYECLTLDEMPTSVCYTTRGYLAKSQDSLMLLPLLGERLRGLLEAYSDQEFKIIESILQTYVSYYGIQTKVREYVSDFIEEEENAGDGIYKIFVERAKTLDLVSLQRLPEELRIRFVTELEEVIKEKKNAIENALNAFECSLKENEQKNILERVLDSMPKTDEVIGIFIKPGEVHLEEGEQILERIALIALFIQHRLLIKHRKLLEEKIRKERREEEIWGDESEKTQMLRYVQEHSKCQITGKEIEACYRKLIDEIMDVVYKRKMEDKIRKMSGGTIKLQVVGDEIEIY